MRRAGARGAEMVVFSGGEPTIREDLPRLFAGAAALGLKAGLITNGRRFVYPGFAARLRGLGLEYAYVSFHSPLRRRHALSAGTDSLAEVLAAIANLVRLGVEVTVNTVVTRHNIQDLRAVVDLLAPLQPRTIKLSALEPKGAALAAPGLVPPLGQASRAIADAIGYGKRRYPGLGFACEGLTPCMIEDFATLDSGLAASGFILYHEATEDSACAPDHRNRAKAAPCHDCADFEACPGVYSDYLQRRPAPPLKPRVLPMANSCVFVRKTRTPAARPFGPRRVSVLERGRGRAYETATTDFSDTEIRRILDLGQLYTTKDGRHSNIDHGRDLVKLHPLPGRNGVYSAAQGRPFARLQAILEDLVGRLRGDVLEVGCGRVPLYGLLAPLARAGRIRYVGLDPEPPGLPPEPGVRFVAREIEGFRAPPAAFDRILMLRSYNHIRLPSRVFPALRRMLRPGGRLIVVDGCAFGLALARQPARARPGQRGHFRNHDSGQARRLLEDFGFAALREVPVQRSGGNEWLLVLRRK